MSNENIEKLLEEWLLRAKQSQLAHMFAAKAFSHRHYYFGIISIILSTIVGTSVFASLSKQMDIKIQIIVGMLSILAAVSLRSTLSFVTVNHLLNMQQRHQNTALSAD